MNPAQLLNPKAFAKEKAKANRRPQNNGPQQTRKPAASSSNNAPPPPSYDPKALLNPKAAGGSGGGSRSTTRLDGKDSDTNQDDADNSNFGISSMIENLHNTHERDDAPSRKRKVQVIEGVSEDERKKAKGQTVHSGSGGMLSNHLKEERKQLAASAGDSIDLTNDDDEVQFVKATTLAPTPASASEDDEVCLGILHANCNVYMIPNTSRGGAAMAVGKDYWPSIGIGYVRKPGTNSVMELTDRLQKKFGHVDPKVASALCPLVDGSAVNDVRLKMYLPARKKNPDEYVEKRVSSLMKLDITVFGRRKFAIRIGAWLSQKQLYLTTPVATVGRPIVNPHDTRPVYTPKQAGTILGPRPQHAVQAVGRTVEEMRREASTMFDGLAKAEDLPEMQANEGIIKSELMAHQKQALHFMMDREREDYTDDSPSHSLWKYRSKDNGRPSWYHVITDTEVFEKPDPIQGGILADVMGLGKTLSILALIAETRDAARRHRREDPPDSEHIEYNGRSTLIICPKSVLSNWQEQIKQHTVDGKMRYYTYHGDSRMQDTEQLSKYDIVLTTYNTAASEFTNGASMKYTALRNINWFRIVLDEAHSIRNPGTKIFKGCCELEAERRWAVTGTPVQNTLNDLGALIYFLRLKPFDNMKTWHQYIMAPFKNGNVDVIQNLQVLSGSITLRRLKNTVGLPERSQTREYLDFSKAEELLYRKFAAKTRTQFHSLSGGGTKLQGKSYAHILKSLGRLRAICAHGREMLTEDDMKDIEGDDPDNAIVLDIGDEPEFETETDFVTDKQAYEYFKMMHDGVMASCESCTDHLIPPDEQDQNEAEDSSEDEGSDSSAGGGTVDTFDGKPNLFGHLTACYHFICTKCTNKYKKEAQQTMTADQHHVCPHCNNYIRYGFFPLRRSILARFSDERKDAPGRAGIAKWDENTYSGPHTKVKALLEDLRQSEIETSQLPEGEPPIRSVVFSGWTQYLDLIEYAFVQNNIGFVRIDGKMSVKQRSESLKIFNTVEHVRVMLVSIKAGGQGLNFTAANKAYVMEPQFNPGVEHQAVDRIHRIGQKRDVVIKHFLMKGSVEDGILKMQQKKEDLAKLSMERKRSKNEDAKMRMEELKELFK